VNPVDESIEVRRGICSGESTFPDDRNAPTDPAKSCDRFGVTRDIALELLLPEYGVGLRSGRVSTSRVVVPVASMNEEGDPVAGEDDIRTSRKSSHVKAIAKAETVKVSSHYPFRLGIATSISGHHPGAYVGADDVCH